MAYYLVSSHAVKNINPGFKQKYTVPDNVRIITTTLEGEQAFFSDSLQFMMYYKVYGTEYIDELYNLLNFYGSTLIDQSKRNIKNNIGFSKYKYIDEVLTTVKSIGEKRNGKNILNQQLMLAFHPGDEMINLLFDFTDKVKFITNISLDDNGVINTEKLELLSLNQNINNILTPDIEIDKIEYGLFFNKLDEKIETQYIKQNKKNILIKNVITEFKPLINSNEFGDCINNRLLFNIGNIVDIAKKDSISYDTKYQDEILEYDTEIQTNPMLTPIQKSIGILTTLPKNIKYKKPLTIFIVGCKVITGKSQGQIFKQKREQLPYKYLQGLPPQYYFKNPKRLTTTRKSRWIS